MPGGVRSRIDELMYRSIAHAALALMFGACSGRSRATAPVATCDPQPALDVAQQLAADGFLFRAFDAATAAHERCPSEATRTAVEAARADLLPYAGVTTTLDAKLRERALVLYRDGVNLRLEGQYDLAVAQLDRSLEIWPHPLTMVQIGLTHEAAGSPIEARMAYARALAAAEDLTGIPATPRVVRGHSHSVDALAYSADGRTVASGSIRQVKLWDTLSGKQTGAFTSADRGSVAHLAFTSRPELLAVAVNHNGDAPTRLELRTLPAGNVARSFEAPGARVLSLVTAGDLVAYAVDRDVFVRTLDGALVLELHHRTDATALALDSGGSRLALGDDDGSVEIWDIGARAQLHRFSKGTREIRGVSFTTDGQHVFLADSLNLGLWEIERAVQVSVADTEIEGVTGISVAHDADLVATSHGSRVRLFDTNTMQLLHELPKGSIHVAVLSPDGSRVAVADGLAVRIYDVPTGEQVLMLGATDQPQGIELSPGRIAVLGGRSLALWNLDAHPGFVAIEIPMEARAALGPDPDRFVFQYGNISVFDSATLETKLSLADSGAVSMSMTYSHDGTMAAAGDTNGVVRVWTVDDGVLVAAIDTEGGGWITDVEFSPDDTIVAASGSFLTLCDIGSGEVIERREIAGYDSIEYRPDGTIVVQAGALAIAGDGSTMARAGSSDTEILLSRGVDAAGDELILRGHDELVIDLEISRDGRYLVSVGADGTIRVWSTGGDYLATLIGDGPDTWLVIAADRRVDGSDAGKELLYWETGDIRLPGFVGWQRHHAPELLGSVMPR